MFRIESVGKGVCDVKRKNSGVPETGIASERTAPPSRKMREKGRARKFHSSRVYKKTLHSTTKGWATSVCRYVAELYAKLPDLEKCKVRAAQRFGISASTVARAWRKRGKENDEDIQISELINYVKTELFPKVFVPEGAAQAALEECNAMIADDNLTAPIG
jgi:hypothetical protein